jgi:hypothetical protein
VRSVKLDRFPEVTSIEINRQFVKMNAQKSSAPIAKISISVLILQAGRHNGSP